MMDRGATTGCSPAAAPGQVSRWSPAIRTSLFGAVSLWHEIHLHGGDYHVAGVAQAGMPAILIGRSRHVAWGITNNICSQRDLYQERTDCRSSRLLPL